MFLNGPVSWNKEVYHTWNVLGGKSFVKCFRRTRWVKRIGDAATMVKLNNFEWACCHYIIRNQKSIGNEHHWKVSVHGTSLVIGCGGQRRCDTKTHVNTSNLVKWMCWDVDPEVLSNNYWYECQPCAYWKITLRSYLRNQALWG